MLLPGSKQDPEPALESLSSESLALLSETLAPLEEDPYPGELAGLDWQLLLGEPGDEPLDPDLLFEVDPADLKSLWNKEG